MPKFLLVDRCFRAAGRVARSDYRNLSPAKPSHLGVRSCLHLLAFRLVAIGQSERYGELTAAGGLRFGASATFDANGPNFQRAFAFLGRLGRYGNVEIYASE